jgi:hypothetical protein
MGARFTFGPSMSLDELDWVHPLARTLAQAVRDYGIYANDTNGAPLLDDKYVGNTRIEPGLIENLYGVDNNDLIQTIELDIADLILDYGFYRIDYMPDPDIEGCGDE